MSKVSIIIPVYNCPYVSVAIESALNQTYKNIEVIVVNDGSTMHSEKIDPYYNRVRYIEKGNGGTASALNMGIKNATGQYFAWLSSDDMFIPHKIEKQLVFMKSHKSSFSHTSYFQMNEHGQVLGGKALQGYKNKMELYHAMLKGCPINGCTVMVSMDVFSIIGTFDESLKYTQDYDFWLRLLQITDVHYLDEPLIQYRVHPGMGSQKFKPQQEQEILVTQQRHRAAIMNLIQKG